MQSQTPTSTLTDSIITQLRAGNYECVVCVSNIRHTAATWSCPQCFRLYHIPCIKKWAQSHGKTDDGNVICPTCKAHSPVPRQYRCFCHKVVDPTPSPYHIPHSCGDPCGRKRGGACTHPCVSLCHPGPCPPCLVPVRLSCHCGKLTVETTCAEAQRGVSCLEVCGKTLQCGNHVCQRTCHDGPCTPCPIATSQPCPCGATTSILPCGSPIKCCSNICKKPLGCGHLCSLGCHTGPCERCPLSPVRQTTCHCGKQALAAIQGNVPRTKCTDPVPSCNSVCGKVLRCGTHTCTAVCHSGDCGDCTATVNACCPCGSIRSFMPCVNTYCPSADNRCNKKCNLKRSCGRHTCQDVCCPKRLLGSAAHPCDLVCNRRLVCSHRCPERCHEGPCPPCLHFITTEIVCPCGGTVLLPPQPCGTPLPNCTLPCRIPRTTCGHPVVAHSCHSGPCPPCTMKTDKMCAGGHGIIANVPCHVAIPTCGHVCAKALDCGHHCDRLCHEGTCRQRGAVCTRECGRPREGCTHPCKAKCHGAAECPPCKVVVKTKCPCGYKSVDSPCGVPTSEVACDDSCFHTKRLAYLEEQAGGSHSDSRHNMFGSATRAGMDGGMQDVFYSIRLYGLGVSSRDAVMSVEKIFKDFLDSRESHFLMPKMVKERRILVYELALFYNLNAQSLPGPPDKKTIDLSKTPQSREPATKLSDAVKMPGMNPHKFLKESTPYPNRVLIFDDCTENDFPSIYHALRTLIGQFVLWFDGKQNTTAVFTTALVANEAYSILRRNATLPIVFHQIGRPPPSRSAAAYSDPTASDSRLGKSSESGAVPVGTKGPKAAPWKLSGQGLGDRPKPKVSNLNRFASLGGK